MPFTRRLAAFLVALALFASLQTMSASVVKAGTHPTPASVATADLFASLVYSEDENNPPPEDSFAIYDSTLNIRDIAAIPQAVRAKIPSVNGDQFVTVKRLTWSQRDGFAERDSQACDHGDISGCEIIPIPELPVEQFSYDWVGRGDGYDLRLTIHHGYAIGVLTDGTKRFFLSWNSVKDINLAYFWLDDSFDDRSDGFGVTYEPRAIPSVPVMTAQQGASLTVKTFHPSLQPHTMGLPEYDLAVLFDEEARQQAGGNPSDCRDMVGIEATIIRGVGDINAALANSGVSGQIGNVSVTRLYGYSWIPYNFMPANVTLNRNRLTANLNIKAYKDAVGADGVVIMHDTQAHLGACGIANVQRPSCGTSTPGCNVGPAFADFNLYINTVQCTITTDAFPHEFGHTQGADHDPAHTGTTPANQAYPYSYGYKTNAGGGFETLMSQEFDSHFPTRLLQFSNPSLTYNGLPTGDATDANNALTVSNLLPGSIAFRSRPDLMFASGFDETIACPGVTY